MPTAVRLLTLAARLQARAQPPRPAGLLPLVIGAAPAGWTTTAVADALAARPGFARRDGTLALAAAPFAECSARLMDAAVTLREAGLLGGWRDETLAVRTADGHILGAIERAACRPLGITTEAVHLNAFSDDGTLIVARRALHKAIDPGLWDNLVGGMVPAGETLEQALEREAWEEAGLALDRLEVHRGRSFHVQRAVPEGWQSERIHVYETTLPAETALANQDGEVATIDRRSLPAVLDAIERDEFTLEAALATLESLTRRAGCAVPPGLYA
jgi:8-oxo-dGTP pyrophosphatase MutT (NUDIX family)